MKTAREDLDKVLLSQRKKKWKKMFVLLKSKHSKIKKKIHMFMYICVYRLIYVEEK